MPHTEKRPPALLRWLGSTEAGQHAEDANKQCRKPILKSVELGVWHLNSHVASASLMH